MLTEEKINLNYTVFISKLQKFGCYTEELENDSEFLNKLKNASAFISEDSGGAYDGSLIEHIIRTSVIAYKLNDSLYKNVQIPLDSLMKVCYLIHISKALVIEKNTSDYEIKKGKLYKYAENSPAIKYGEFSLFLCTKYGINLSINEYEAILSIDKENDLQSRYFGSILASIVKSSNEVALSERRSNYKNFIDSNKE